MSNENEKINGSNPVETKVATTIAPSIDMDALVARVTEAVSSTIRPAVTEQISHIGNRVDGYQTKTVAKADALVIENDKLRAEAANNTAIINNLQGKAVHSQVISKLTTDGVKPGVAAMLANDWVNSKKISYNVNTDAITAVGTDVEGKPTSVSLDSFYNNFKTTDAAKDFLPAPLNSGDKTKISLEGKVDAVSAGALSLEQATQAIDKLPKDKSYESAKLAIYKRVH